MTVGERRADGGFIIDALDRIETKVDGQGRRLSRIEGGLVLGAFILTILSAVIGGHL